jgi:hypothetical protein
VESLRLYPEVRACRYPTTRRLLEVFEDVQRHRLKVGAEPAVLFTTKLSPSQKKVLRLLGLPLSAYDAWADQGSVIRGDSNRDVRKGSLHP